MSKYKMLDELSVLQERFASGMGWRDGEYAEALDEAIELINNIPSTDVVEVKHGEWETIDYDDGEYEFRCSNCRSQFDMVAKTNFCPNCGADMRGETK